MLLANRTISRSDMIRCALCANAPCDAACEKLNPAGLLRSIWFSNEQAAAQRLPGKKPCIGCPAPCEQACVRPAEVPIRALVDRLYDQVLPECETPIPENEDRLKCDLCGIPLENPFLLSSSVVASTYDTLRHCLPDCLVRAKHKPHQAACPARDSCVHEFTRHALKAAHDSRFSCVSLNTELPNSLFRCSDPPCSPPRSPLSKLPRSVLLTAPSLSSHSCNIWTASWGGIFSFR